MILYKVVPQFGIAIGWLVQIYKSNVTMAMVFVGD